VDFVYERGWGNMLSLLE